jgi:hypothetical protein
MSLSRLMLRILEWVTGEPNQKELLCLATKLHKAGREIDQSWKLN